MSPAQFGSQLDWLRESGTPVVKLSEVVGALGGGAALPRRAVVITFDDAYEDFCEQALPALLARGFTATLFAVSGQVGKTNAWDQARGEPSRPILSWARLREVAAAGIEIGSHSRSHPDLRSLPDQELGEECRRSRLELEDGLGRAVRYFAYPHGRYDGRVKVAVREAGYEAACAVLLRPWDMLRSEAYALMRVIVHGTKSFSSFKRRVRLAAPPHRMG